MIFLTSDTGLSFYTGESAGENVSWTIPSIADDTWHHIAVVRDATGNAATLYIDGVSQGTQGTTLNALSIDVGGLMLGQEQDSVGGGFQSSQAVDGSFDDVRIYTRTLSGVEVLALVP